MGQKLHTVENEPGMLVFQCPACGNCHFTLVEGATRKGPRWTWNGSTDRPTFQPSIKVSGVKSAFQPFDPTPTVCHFWVKDGHIEYCGDSTHALAGKTVEIPDWD
jgi:hypothetical protein